MAAAREHPQPSLFIRRNQRLVVVPTIDDQGEPATLVYVEDTNQDGTSRRDQERIEAALTTFGAWSDLDADQVLDDLERIRHESKPTPLYKP